MENISPSASASDDSANKTVSPSTPEKKAAEVSKTSKVASSEKKIPEVKKKPRKTGSKGKAPKATFMQEPTEPPRDPVEISLRTLLEAGVHFGHQCSRWSPKMAHYIYTSRNGIHIIDLPKSVQAWKFAREEIVKTVGSGKTVLFVGTKKQAQDAVAEEARRCGAYYVTRRWLGGMITNFQTIRKSIERMKRVEEILEEEEALVAKGETSNYKKKERLLMKKELDKLEFSLGGIRNMHAPPGLMFIVDIKREDIAIKEAKRLDIPVVGLVDTNCDPEKVDYPIPSNDDGTRAVRLFSAAVCDAVLEGQKLFKKSGGLPEVSKKEFEAAKEKKDETESVPKDEEIVSESSAKETVSEPAVEEPAVETSS